MLHDLKQTLPVLPDGAAIYNVGDNFFLKWGRLVAQSSNNSDSDYLMAVQSFYANTQNTGKTVMVVTRVAPANTSFVSAVGNGTLSADHKMMTYVINSEADYKAFLSIMDGGITKVRVDDDALVSTPLTAGDVIVSLASEIDGDGQGIYTLPVSASYGNVSAPKSFTVQTFVSTTSGGEGTINSDGLALATFDLSTADSVNVKQVFYNSSNTDLTDIKSTILFTGLPISVKTNSFVNDVNLLAKMHLTAPVKVIDEHAQTVMDVAISYFAYSNDDPYNANKAVATTWDKADFVVVDQNELGKGNLGQIIYSLVMDNPDKMRADADLSYGFLGGTSATLPDGTSFGSSIVSAFELSLIRTLTDTWTYVEEQADGAYQVLDQFPAKVFVGKDGFSYNVPDTPDNMWRVTSYRDTSGQMISPDTQITMHSSPNEDGIYPTGHNYQVVLEPFGTKTSVGEPLSVAESDYYETKTSVGEPLSVAESDYYETQTSVGEPLSVTESDYYDTKTSVGEPLSVAESDYYETQTSVGEPLSVAESDYYETKTSVGEPLSVAESDYYETKTSVGEPLSVAESDYYETKTSVGEPLSVAESDYYETKTSVGEPLSVAESDYYETKASVGDPLSVAESDYYETKTSVGEPLSVTESDYYETKASVGEPLSVAESDYYETKTAVGEPEHENLVTENEPGIAVYEKVAVDQPQYVVMGNIVPEDKNGNQVGPKIPYGPVAPKTIIDTAYGPVMIPDVGGDIIVLVVKSVINNLASHDNNNTQQSEQYDSVNRDANDNGILKFEVNRGENSDKRLPKTGASQHNLSDAIGVSVATLISLLGLVVVLKKKHD
jgi:hypothetical protein